MNVDQCTYLGVDISEDCSWDSHVAKAIGKGESHVGKMDEILTDSHVDTGRRGTGGARRGDEENRRMWH